MASLGDWPRLSSVTTPWSPRIPHDLLTRAQRERYRGPYEAAVVPLIADLTPTVDADLARLTNDASTTITRFDAGLGTEIAPFSTILLRSEAAASSQIENLSSGAKQIALAELGSRQKRNAAQIVGNVAAMRAALALADDLDADAILDMHRTLLIEHAPDIAGRWRDDQVWVGGSSIGPHDADYIAPVPDAVPGLIDDLVLFMRRDDLPPLVQIALAHAQFETIHPFPDGNGRTGRAIVQSMLRSRGLTGNVTAPVSAGLLTDTGHYFRALEAYRRGEIGPIVQAVAAAALSAVANGSLLVAGIRRIRVEWESRLTVRSDSAAYRLLDVLLRQPVVDAAAVADSLGISAANVSRVVRPLVDAGIVGEFTGFTRNRMWCADEVTDALDQFASRAVRGS